MVGNLTCPRVLDKGTNNSTLGVSVVILPQKVVNFSPSYQELDSGAIHKNVKKLFFDHFSCGVGASFPSAPQINSPPLHPWCCQERWSAGHKKISVV